MPKGLTSHILRVLKEYEIENKVLCQTYDRATVKTGRLNGLQAIVREHCPMALFVHCQAHKLNLAFCTELKP